MATWNCKPGLLILELPSSSTRVANEAHKVYPAQESRSKRSISEHHEPARSDDHNASGSTAKQKAAWGALLCVSTPGDRKRAVEGNESEPFHLENENSEWRRSGMLLQLNTYRDTGYSMAVQTGSFDTLQSHKDGALL